MSPVFMAFVTEKPLLFALFTHVLFKGNVAPSNTVKKLENFVSSNTESCTFGEYFQVQIWIKVMNSIWTTGFGPNYIWMNYIGSTDW